MKISQRIPPVQYVKIFFFPSKRSLFSCTHSGNSRKLSMSGRIAPRKCPTSYSYSFLVSKIMVSSSCIASNHSSGDKYSPVISFGSTSSSKRNVTSSFRGRTCIFLNAWPSCSSILKNVSLKRSSACICSIYFSVCSTVPETVPLIPL